ncbi:MAG: hypothetical protein IKO27_08445 [Ruminococcus sp.]|nr:hypothetical protein [Ruminococcus sp.]
MSLFKKYKPSAPPKGCEGLEIRTESSTCTGETVIGFYDPVSKKLLCSELVRSSEDIEAFCRKYGRESVKKK